MKIPTTFTLTKLASLACALATSLSAAPELKLELSYTIQVESIVDGKKSVTYITQESTQPGNKLAYTIRYTNVGDENANGAALVGVIPEGTSFLEVLTMPDGTELTYSANAGADFAPAPLKAEVLNADGSKSTREFGPESYTHVRFKLSEPVTPGQSGSVSYLVQVN